MKIFYQSSLPRSGAVKHMEANFSWYFERFGYAFHKG